MKLIHAGQQLVNIGRFLFSLNLFINSAASSIIVRSAPKFVSNTYLNPKDFNAATILPVDIVPASNPNSSPIATLTEGATWTTTVFSFWCRASHTSGILFTSVKAPVGHTEIHWPQNVHSVSHKLVLKKVPTLVLKPLLTPDKTPTVWISLHIVSHLLQSIHLS